MGGRHGESLTDIIRPCREPLEGWTAERRNHVICENPLDTAWNQDFSGALGARGRR